MRSTLILLFGVVVSLQLGCSNSGGGSFNKLLDDTSSSPLEKEPCSVKSFSPSSATLRWGASGGPLNFSVETAGVNCQVSYFLDDVEMKVEGTVLNLNQSSLRAGPHKVRIAVTNKAGVTNQDWTLQPNNSPICQTQIPDAATTTQASAGTPLTLTASGQDPDGDNLIYAWKFNGTAAPSSAFSIVAIGSASQAVYTPAGSHTGTNNITVDISDGYDVAHCSYTVQVSGACSIADYNPSTSSFRVSASPNTNTSFGVVPSLGSGCTVTWQLRGTDFANPGNFVSVNSATHLTTGANVLTARVSGGGGTYVEKRWTLTKNSPPVCASTGLNAPTPNLNGYSLNYNTSTPVSIGIDDSVDRDTLSVSWLLNGLTPSSGTVIDNILWSSTSPFTAYSGKASMTFRPLISNLGFNNIVARAYDGYDSSDCTWNIQVLDPTGFNVLSCDSSAITQNAPNPNIAAASHSNINALIKSEGGNRNSIITLSPLAVGSGVTYTWTKSGVATGTVGSTIVLDNSLPAGTHIYKVTMTDAFGSTNQFCEWRVKRNTKPSITGTLPTMYPGQQRYYMNHLDSLSLGVTAVDPDPDDNPLTYTWTVNGLPNSKLVATGGTANFIPAADETLRGDVNIGVQVSDGDEVVNYSWIVRVNAFSSYCNEVYNLDPSVVSNQSKTCTLVGDPRIGTGFDPTAEPTLARLRPKRLLEDPSPGSPGFFIVSDYPAGVYYWNRSAGSVVKAGITCPPNQVTRLLGLFGQGTPPSMGAKAPDVKVGDSYGVEYDAANGYLYFADESNSAVYQVNSSRDVTLFLGTNSTTQSTATNTEGQLGADPANPGVGAVCGTPRYLKIQTVGAVRWLYVACATTHAIKRIGIDPNDSATYRKTQFVVGALSSGATTAGVGNGQAVNTPGTSAPGAAPTYAQVSSPFGIDVDKNGVVYWTDRSSASTPTSIAQSKLRVANLSASPIKFFNNALTVNPNQTADLVGKGYVNTTAYNSTNIGVSLGRTALYSSVTITDPGGISLDTAGESLTVPRGIWISTWTGARPIYANFDTSAITIGGTSIPAGYVGSVAQDLQSFLDGVIASSYFYTITDVRVSNDGKYLWVVDNGNVRIRAMNISDSSPPADLPLLGSVKTIYGAGFPRFGTVSSDIPTYATRFSPYAPYGMAINKSQWKMYFSEQFSGRIRQVDLRKGIVETYAGRGLSSSNASTQGVLMGAGSMMYPKGLTIIPGVEPIVMWVEANISTGSLLNSAAYYPAASINTPCLVRAANGNSTTKNIMGTNIDSGTMSVVIGSYAAGCGTPSNGGTATTVKTRGPHNVYYNEVTGDTIFIDTSAHCVHKVTSSGVASVFLGNCGTPNTTGTSQPAENEPDGGTFDSTLRLPTSIVADPIEPQNYFIVDQYDNYGKVRYVNTTSTDQTVNGITVKSKASNPVRIQKVWSDTTSGSLNYIAAYKINNTNAVICISSGAYASGTSGDHKIFCFNRDGSGSRNFGGKDRGASPQDLSEEGVLAVNANFFNPTGLDFDEEGNLYVAEKTGSLIRMIRRWF